MIFRENIELAFHQSNEYLLLYLFLDEPEILLELVYSEPVSTDVECSA